MIPILYQPKERNFTHGGIGFLSEAVSCVVSEERNGEFVCELQYPVSGRLYENIIEDCIIKAKPNDTSNPQPFRIYKSSKPINGIVTFNAEHISYELSGNPIKEVAVSSANATTAMNAVLTAATIEHPYTATSDIDTLNSTSLEFVSVRAAFGGVDGSMLDTYGGEYEFDVHNIKLHRNRGRDTGIIVAYGKNLTDIKQEKSISEVYTAIYPYAKYTPAAEEGSEEEPTEIKVTLPEKIIYAPNAAAFAYTRTLMLDMSGDFKDGEAITEEALRTKATLYMERNKIYEPKVSITIAFVNLFQSPEYAKYALLERVNLCDTVTVHFEKLGIDVSSKIIKTKYDGLTEKYISLDLGDTKSNFADTMKQTASDIQNIKQEIKKQTTAANVKLAQAIANATALITGQKGGYVVLNPSNNPQEILIMDTPDIETAINIWRWNSGGLGHSSNGYNGPFELAITADGAIVADFITAGTLNGALLQVDSVKATAISQGYKSEVTNEITGQTNEVEQAFVAADEQLRSLIQSVSTELSGDIASTETQISNILQTVNDLTFSFTTQYTGGINHVSNSSGLNGVSSDWLYTGAVQSLQNNDTKNNTLASACYWLGAGTLSQEISVIAGAAYTLTFKAKKTAVRGWVKVISGGNEIEVMNSAEQEEWTEHTVTFISASNALTLEVYSYSDYLYIADIMLAEGNTKQRWTPAPNEIYTTDVKIDRHGIHITNTESETSTIINNVEFAVLYREEKVITVNKDTTILKKTVIQAEMTVGKLKTIPVDGGVDEVLLD